MFKSRQSWRWECGILLLITAEIGYVELILEVIIIIITIILIC